ncbi:hypothetical protein KIN20_028001 [Parelaphostrongylus tenuis]|uniref:Uncharacterized protein n=1 Tax=Parelaphostrongylus tenuis TaxID=148309 RepID=A0AAD5WEG2_PARTN|nr:hypothetical protein KIN20_028001 [Parelaphostrongylus tenuis]
MEALVLDHLLVHLYRNLADCLLVYITYLLLANSWAISGERRRKLDIYQRHLSKKQLYCNKTHFESVTQQGIFICI